MSSWLGNCFGFNGVHTHAQLLSFFLFPLPTFLYVRVVSEFQVELNRSELRTRLFFELPACRLKILARWPLALPTRPAKPFEEGPLSLSSALCVDARRLKSFGPPAHSVQPTTHRFFFSHPHSGGPNRFQNAPPNGGFNN